MQEYLTCPKCGSTENIEERGYIDDKVAEIVYLCDSAMIIVDDRFVQSKECAKTKAWKLFIIAELSQLKKQNLTK